MKVSFFGCTNSIAVHQFVSVFTQLPTDLESQGIEEIGDFKSGTF